MSIWRTENWEVSHYNWMDDVRGGMNPPDRFMLHDISMRDGAHVVDYSNKERIELATALSDLGVQRIEIESRAPIITRQSIYPPEEHWETLRNIANMGLRSEVCTMRNVSEGYSGIDNALECDVASIILQEPVHRGWLEGLGQTLEQRLEIIDDVIGYAKDHGCFVTFFNSHIGLSKLDYLLTVVEAGVEAGANSLCITDSEGICTPQTFRFFVEKYIESSKGSLPVEVHSHNDFGLALANIVSSYEAGASIAHCSVNNLGSRTGNASLEEVVISFHVLYGEELGLNYNKLNNIVELVEKMQQWPLAKNKPLYGYGVNESPYKMEYFGKTPHIK